MSVAPSAAGVPQAIAGFSAPVVPGVQYRIRWPAVDPDSGPDGRALVACVRFLDAEGNEIQGDYAGCFRSDRFGQYVYLPAVREGEPPPWCSQSLRAPDGAFGIELALHRWKASRQVQVLAPPEIAGAGDDLFDQTFDVRGGFPHRLRVALEDVRHAERAAVLQVRYLDGGGAELAGPYPGCNQSERFGPFVYLSTPKSPASEIAIQLEVPERARRVRLVGLRWKGMPGLRLGRELCLEAQVPPGIDADQDGWIAVGTESRELTVAVPPGAAGKPMLVTGAFAAVRRPDTGPALRMVFDWLDASGKRLAASAPSGARRSALEDPVRTLEATGAVERFVCMAACPNDAATLRLRIGARPGTVTAAVHRDIAVQRFDGSLEMAQHMCLLLGAAQVAEHRVPAFPEWKLRIDFEAMRPRDAESPELELCVFFGDARNLTIAPEVGHVVARAGVVHGSGKTIRLLPEGISSASPGLEALRGVLQLSPPPGAETVIVRIRNTGKGDLAYTCAVQSFDELVGARLGASSIHSAVRAEAASPEAASLMVESLLGRFPDEPAVVSGALDVFRKLGNASRMEDVATRALAHRKMPGTLKFKARHILASLEEQDPRWSIEVPGNWTGQGPVPDATRPLRVAHLFKTSVPYENTGGAIRCLNIVKFQKEAGMDPLVITPLGYPALNACGEPWEREDVEGIPHFRLNGISRDDLRTIPTTRQLEYSALLTANLLREHGVDLIQASSGYRGYEQALVGLSVARKLRVPFVYEVRSYHEHTWRPIADWVLDSEFTRRRIEQENRCMREADAVVTICETMKEGLIARGIDQDKVFVVPNSVDLDKFEPRAPDPALRARLGLRGGMVAGYISNLSAREGHAVLLRAVALVRDAGLDLQCLIVGTGPELANLQSLALELGIAENVVFTGEVPHEAIPDYYALIDIFVVPRIADFASDFVTPMKPFEAMAMGKPVVISDRPALQEVVEPGVRGLVYPAGDAGALGRLLTRLVEDQPLRERIGGNGRAWVEDCRTWGTIIGIYDEVYRKAFSRAK